LAQAVLLLSFQSDEESLGLSTLKERLNVPTEQMKPLLHSLSCGRYKVGNGGRGGRKRGGKEGGREGGREGGK
jgi:hypothetical protein